MRGQGAGTGSEFAVLMSAHPPRQLCAFPFFCLLLLFFFSSPAAALGLSWSPDSSPTGLPVLRFVSLAAKSL